MSGISAEVKGEIPALPDDGRPLVTIRPASNGYIVLAQYGETDKENGKFTTHVFVDYDHLEAFLGNVLT